MVGWNTGWPVEAALHKSKSDGAHGFVACVDVQPPIFLVFCRVIGILLCPEFDGNAVVVGEDAEL